MKRKIRLIEVIPVDQPTEAEILEKIKKGNYDVPPRLLLDVMYEVKLEISREN